MPVGYGSEFLLVLLPFFLRRLCPPALLVLCFSGLVCLLLRCPRLFCLLVDNLLGRPASLLLVVSGLPTDGENGRCAVVADGGVICDDLIPGDFPLLGGKVWALEGVRVGSDAFHESSCVLGVLDPMLGCALGLER